jgi:hypothetical protein
MLGLDSDDVSLLRRFAALPRFASASAVEAIRFNVDAHRRQPFALGY